jgi:hypothetical protein
VPGSFFVEWLCEVADRSCEIDRARILVSDVGGISASDVRQICQNCLRSGERLVLFTPGIDQSALELVRRGVIAAVKAEPLTDQPIEGILGDLASITGASMLSRDLGFGLELSDSLPEVTGGGLVLPVRWRWTDLARSDLGTARHIAIGPSGTSIRYKRGNKPCRERVKSVALALRRTSDPQKRRELESRLRRLGSAPPPADSVGPRIGGPGAIDVDGGSTNRLEMPCGLASSYFVTDPDTMQCALSDASVLLADHTVNRLEMVVPVLERFVEERTPLLLVAPQVSGAALATLVINKLRGTLKCAAIVLDSEDRSSFSTILDQLAALTGARVIGGEEWHLLADPDSCVLGAGTEIRATEERTVLYAQPKAQTQLDAKSDTGKRGTSPFVTFQCPQCGSVYQVGLDANLCAMDVAMGDMSPMLGLQLGLKGEKGRQEAPDAVQYYDCRRLSREHVAEMTRHVTTAAGAVKGGTSRWWKCEKCETVHGYSAQDVKWFV